MHDVAVQLTKFVLPRGLKTPPQLSAGCREEGRVDTAVRTGTLTVGHNSVATNDDPRESVPVVRGNVQPQTPLWGIPAG